MDKFIVATRKLKVLSIHATLDGATEELKRRAKARFVLHAIESHENGD